MALAPSWNGNGYQTLGFRLAWKKPEGLRLEASQPAFARRISLVLDHRRVGILSGIVIAKLIEVNTVLTSLDLSYNNLQSEGGKALASALEVNTVLTKLDVRANQLGASQQLLRDAVCGRDGFELLM